MASAGLCQICESRRAGASCENCGTLVCEVHYERRLGLCVECASRTSGGPDDTGDRDDVDQLR